MPASLDDVLSGSDVLRDQFKEAAAEVGYEKALKEAGNSARNTAQAWAGGAATATHYHGIRPSHIGKGAAELIKQLLA
jgi:hypothetical protein